jgi:hypothetical protein
MGSTIRLTRPFFCSQTAYPNTAMVQSNQTASPQLPHSVALTARSTRFELTYSVLATG